MGNEPSRGVVDEEVQISFENIALSGHLVIPQLAKGIVLFAHGSGSSRFSPRNQLVARFLNQQKIGTLLIDLLTQEENEIDERTRHFRFDITLLASRLDRITSWLFQDKRTQSHLIGYFGASTGSAAALIAGAKWGDRIAAIVSRGGRVDLAASALHQLKSPTLFLVGERDEVVLEWNQTAFEQLTCPKKLEIIRAATHLFEEPGCLEQVAKISANWFINHF